MKPVYLRLLNIGPYRNESVNFEDLGNMFLIWGDTGSGKTFIFDAIIYALYGKQGNSSVGRENSMRSHFSDLSEKAEIEYVFTLGNEKFRVLRCLEYKKGNNKNLTDEEVTIEKFIAEKNCFEPFGNDQKKKSVEKRISSLLHLSCDEFKKLIILPQGEFSNFLKAKTSEKMQILEKLFPVDLYKKASETIFEKAKDAKNKIENQIQIITSNKNKEGFDYSNAPEIISQENSKIEKLCEELKKINENQISIAEKLSVLEREEKDCLEFIKNQNKKLELEKNQEEISFLENKINRAQESQKIIHLLKNRNELKISGEKFLESQKNKINEKNNAEKTKQILDSQKSEIQKNEEEILELNTFLSEIKQKIEKCSELEQKQKNAINENSVFEKAKLIFEEKQNQVLKVKNEFFEISKKEIKNESDFSSEILNLKEKYENSKRENEKLLEEKTKSLELEKIQDEISSLKNEFDFVKKSFEDSSFQKNNLEKIKESNFAFFLASKLKDGNACPVCGSKNHPAKAESCDFKSELKKFTNFSELNLENTNEILEKALSDCEQKCQQLNAKKAEIEANINSASKRIEEYKNIRKKDEINSLILENQKILENSKINYEKAGDLYEKFLLLNKDFLDSKEKMNLLEKSKISASQIYETTLKENFDGIFPNIEDLQNEKSKIEEKIKNQTKIDSDYEESVSKNSNLLSELNAQISEIEKNICENKIAYEKAKNEFSELFEKSLFKKNNEDENSVFSSYLNDEEIQEILFKVEKWKKDYTEICALIKNSQEIRELKSIQEEKNSIAEQKNILSEQNEVKSKQKDSLTKNVIFIKNLYDETLNAENEKSRLEKESESLRELAKLLTSGTVKLEVWVIGLYFEKVLKAANFHLLEFSGGRYELKLDKRNDSMKGQGLDLFVLDSNTGQSRDVGTLSGGETFEASISLALGLTDVVQSSSGGIRLDSLFIDEGFATLDSDLLDKATSILTQLQETKTVGVISHLETLLSSVPNRLEVQKGNDGSKLKVTV